MLFALGFVFLVALGGFAHVMLTEAGVDRGLHDSYYVVAHFYYTMSIGAIFLLFAGWCYCFPKVTGRTYSERLGKLHFWLLFIGVNMALFPWLFVWPAGMLRRDAEYAVAFTLWNQVSSAGVIIAGLAMIVFLYCMLRAFWRKG